MTETAPIPAFAAAGLPDVERHFRTDRIRSQLKDRSVRGAAASIASQFLKLFLQTGQTFILARMLLPSDFGLVAMVTSVVAFLDLVNDLGLLSATVQREEVSHDQISRLFWINVLSSTLTGAMALSLGPLLAWYYHEPRLLWLTVLVGSEYVFSGLYTQHQAILVRQMRFTALALIDICCVALGIAVSLIAARFGAGYWAIALASPAAALVRLPCILLATGWLPALPSRRGEIRSMLAFGTNVSASNLLNYLSRNLDNVLVGRYCGAWELGLYSKAYNLLMLPLVAIGRPLQAVAVPALSRLQNDLPRFKAYYRRAVLLISGLSMPMVVLSFVSADKIILGLMGPKWGQAVLIFRLLAPAAFVGTTNIATTLLYMSLGQNHRQLRMLLVVAPLTILSFIFGCRWGAPGVAAAYSAYIVLGRIPTIIYCCRTMPISTAEVLGAMARPTVVSLLAGAALFAIDRALDFQGPHLLGLAIDVPLFTLCYCVIWLTTPGGFQIASEAIELVRKR